MEKTFRLNLHTDNEAFAPDVDRAPTAQSVKDETARILEDTAARLRAGEDFDHFRTLFDINGNDVGRAAFKPADYR